MLREYDLIHILFRVMIPPFKNFTVLFNSLCCSLCILSGQTTAKCFHVVGTSTQLNVCLHYFGETMGWCLETISSGETGIINNVIVVKTMQKLEFCFSFFIKFVGLLPNPRPLDKLLMLPHLHFLISKVRRLLLVFGILTSFKTGIFDS